MDVVVHANRDLMEHIVVNRRQRSATQIRVIVSNKRLDVWRDQIGTLCEESKIVKASPGAPWEMRPDADGRGRHRRRYEAGGSVVLCIDGVEQDFVCPGFGIVEPAAEDKNALLAPQRGELIVFVERVEFRLRSPMARYSPRPNEPQSVGASPAPAPMRLLTRRCQAAVAAVVSIINAEDAAEAVLIVDQPRPGRDRFGRRR